MSIRRFIFPLIVLVSLALACNRGPRIIPRDTMTEIYADMFLADQWLSDHSSERSKADTSLFYDPIIASYGYTFEEFDASVKRYLKDPERYSKMLRNTAGLLKDHRDAATRKAELLEKVAEFNSMFKGYDTLDFAEDTVLWVTQDVRDSIRRAYFVSDSIERAAFVRDSLQRDSVLRDSLERYKQHIDSTLQQKRNRNFSDQIL